MGTYEFVSRNEDAPSWLKATDIRIVAPRAPSRPPNTTLSSHINQWIPVINSGSKEEEISSTLGFVEYGDNFTEVRMGSGDGRSVSPEVGGVVSFKKRWKRGKKFRFRTKKGSNM